MNVDLTVQELDLIALALYVFGTDLLKQPEDVDIEVDGTSYTREQIDDTALGLVTKLYPEIQNAPVPVST